MKRLPACLIAVAALALAHPCPGRTAGGGGGGGPRASGVHVDWGLLKVPDFAAEYQRGYERGRRMAAERAQESRGRAAGRAEVDRDERSRLADLARGDAGDRAAWASRLVAAGHCGEARNFALGQGDLDLATRVTNICRRRATPW